ncbi:unnamed protein product [Chrysoparadoxa australica]
MALTKHQVKFAMFRGEDPSLLATTQLAPVAGGSKRFMTTSLTGTEEVASRRDEVPDRAQMARELRERKLRNNRTSVVLGHTPIKYESDAMSRQQDILGAPPRTQDIERNKILKQALTRSNFKFGEEPLEYAKTSTQPDPTGHLEDYTGVLNNEVKDMIKKSNMYFGSAPPMYKSVMNEEMEIIHRVPAGEIRGPDVEGNKKLKQALTRTHFNFGEEEMQYISDYKRGFNYDAEVVKNMPQVSLAAEVKADLRRSHFTFGNHKATWETDSHSSQRVVLDHETTTPEEILAQKRRNAQLKTNLQRTNISMGNDEEYM